MIKNTCRWPLSRFLPLVDLNMNETYSQAGCLVGWRERGWCGQPALQSHLLCLRMQDYSVWRWDRGRRALTHRAFGGPGLLQVGRSQWSRSDRTTGPNRKWRSNGHTAFETGSSSDLFALTLSGERTLVIFCPQIIRTIRFGSLLESFPCLSLSEKATRKT